jgi:hypothetical protein
MTEGSGHGLFEVRYWGDRRAIRRNVHKFPNARQDSFVCELQHFRSFTGRPKTYVYFYIGNIGEERRSEEAVYSEMYGSSSGWGTSHLDQHRWRSRDSNLTTCSVAILVRSRNLLMLDS